MCEKGDMEIGMETGRYIKHLKAVGYEAKCMLVGGGVAHQAVEEFCQKYAYSVFDRVKIQVTVCIYRGDRGRTLQFARLVVTAREFYLGKRHNMRRTHTGSAARTGIYYQRQAPVGGCVCADYGSPV